jgi:hypothetical protein
MKRARFFVVGLAALALLAPGPLPAQQDTVAGVRQPSGVEKTILQFPGGRWDDYTFAYQEEGIPGESPSDAPLPDRQPSDAPGRIQPEQDLLGGLGSPQTPQRFEPERAGPPQPWSLPQPGWMQRMGIKMGGWLEQGITFNGTHPADGFNGPVATNDLDSEYQMNQLWLFFDRPADTGGYGWAVGGHIDLLYGTDWRFGINKGLEDRINSFNYQTYGMVIPQIYAEVAVNDLSVKMGHFAGILDYEAVPAVLNPFYSHSYSYGYTVPQLVTGLLGDYKLTDQWSVQAGFHRGWMMWEDNNNSLDVMGGVRWLSLERRVALAYAISSGPQDDAGRQNRFVYSLVGKVNVTERLEYIAVHNLGYENNGDPRSDNDAEWYGLNQYFLYTINPKWLAGVRFEWLRDDDGARVAGPGNIPGVRAFSGGPGFAGNFYALTAGLNYRPCPNVVFRPEVRWDWYNGTPDVRGDLPFDGGNGTSQVLFGMDLIVTF